MNYYAFFKHVARMREGEVHTGLWWGNLSERNH
jgi:hypothetical protein